MMMVQITKGRSATADEQKVHVDGNAAADVNNVKIASSDGVISEKFVFGCSSPDHITNNDDGKAHSNNEDEDEQSSGEDEDEKPCVAFDFTNNPQPKFRPHLKPKSRRAGHSKYTLVNAQTSGFSSKDANTLDDAPLLGLARSMSSFSKKVLDKAELEDAFEKMNMSKPASHNMTSTIKPPQFRKPSTRAQKQSIFIQPPRARESRVTQAPARVSSPSNPLQLEVSFPDENNTFYHPSMTLQTAAQQLIGNFRAADRFLAHYCDDQIAQPTNFKPLVVEHMDDMVRDLRYAAQFLRLGKLGWDLVTLPHEFFEDAKAVIPGLKIYIQRLCAKRNLRFLVDGLVEVERVEVALGKLQGRRRELEMVARIQWETGRVGNSVEAVDSKLVSKGKVDVEDEKMKVAKENAMLEAAQQGDGGEQTTLSRPHGH